MSLTQIQKQDLYNLLKKDQKKVSAMQDSSLVMPDFKAVLKDYGQAGVAWLSMIFRVEYNQVVNMTWDEAIQDDCHKAVEEMNELVEEAIVAKRLEDEKGKE